MTDTDGTVEDVLQRLSTQLRRDAPFEEKVEDVLDAGRRYLGVGQAYLAKIEPRADRWEAVVSVPEGAVFPGHAVDLRETYCSQTVADDRTLTVADTAEHDADGAPSPPEGVGCYLGTPVRLGEELYGTVCFLDADARASKFSDAEVLFGGLAAQVLERELVRERNEEKLMRETNLTAVLNRVLRHNFRNEMSVIRGYTERMSRELDDDRLGATALRSVDRVLELAGKARKLDRVVAADSEFAVVDLAERVAAVTMTVRESFPEASITVDADGPVTAEVAPSFDQAIEELIENAAKHAGPSVRVAVRASEERAEVRIADDGPGLPDQETRVLESGAETPLVHGSGLGLWLAHWVVTGHGGTIDVEVDDGTTMTVSVPLDPDAVPGEGLTEVVRPRDQYEAVFDRAPDPILILDDGTHLLDANRAAADLLGVDKRRLVGQPLSEVCRDEDAVASVRAAIEDSTVTRDEIRLVDETATTHRLEYASRSNFVPGQHVVIARETLAEATGPVASDPQPGDSR